MIPRNFHHFPNKETKEIISRLILMERWFERLNALKQTLGLEPYDSVKKWKLRYEFHQYK